MIAVGSSDNNVYLLEPSGAESKKLEKRRHPMDQVAEVERITLKRSTATTPSLQEHWLRAQDCRSA